MKSHPGLVMASLSQQVPLPFTTIEVEVLVARRSVEFSIELGLDRIVLEGDSQILIDTLQSRFISLAQFGNIVNDVQYIAS